MNDPITEFMDLVATVERLTQERDEAERQTAAVRQEAERVQSAMLSDLRERIAERDRADAELVEIHDALKRDCNATNVASIVCAALEIVDPPEEPMPAVALDGERCECCGRAFTPGEQVASFASEDVVACYGPCPEPEMWRVEYEYLDTEEAQRRVGGRGPMPYEEAVVIGGNFRRLPLVDVRVRLVRVKEPRRG